MNRFNRFTALRWMYNIIVPPRYRDKLNITEELCALESAVNKVIEVTNANGKALEAISQDLEDIQFGAGGYYRPAITENEDGSVTFSFAASDESMPPIEEKTFFFGDMQTITEMLQGFNGDPMAVKNYIDEKSSGYYTPVFEQSGNTVAVSFTASNEMLPALNGYSFTLPSGSPGKSAYDSYLDNGGTMTEKVWVDSLKGKDGESFYQMCVKNGFVGSETDLIIAMKGDPYELTETDITTIVQKVVENLGGQPVAGYFNADNNVVLNNKSLTNGNYILYYRDEQGNLHEYAAMTVTNTYAITWVVDGQVYTERVKEGDVPTFSGNTDKATDGQYTYTFKGWDKAVVAATEDVTYTALYDKTPIETEPTTYTITWVVDGKTTDETYEAGDTPVFKGSTDKATDDTYDYTFTGWSPAISPVTGNKLYTAQYAQSPKNWLKVVGYNVNTRVSSSQATAAAALQPREGACASNLIPVSDYTKRIYIENVSLGDQTGVNNVALYDKDGNRLYGIANSATPGVWCSGVTPTANGCTFVVTSMVNETVAATVAYFLFSCGVIDDNSIVTIGIEPV